MANAWKNPSAIAMEALMHLEDSLVISNMAARDKTGEFVNKPMKIGEQVSIRTRPDYEAKEFTGTGPVVAQDIRESTRPFVIEKLLDISVKVTAREKAMEMDDFAEQVIIPAVYRLAEKCDIHVGTKILEAAGLYESTNLLGSAADVALARKAANLQQLEPGRFAIVDPTLEATLLGQTWFNQSQTRGSAGESTLQSGLMGRVMGIDWASSVNFPTTALTTGNGTTNTDNTVATDNLIGNTTLVVDAIAGGNIEAGDRIQIAGVKRPLLVKTQAVATATSIALEDPITEIIPDNAAVTVIGAASTTTTFQGAIFDSSSLALAMPPLDAPSDKPSFTATNNGYSIRVTQGYDMDKKQETMSLDLMIGATAWDPRRITLLGSSA